MAGTNEGDFVVRYTNKDIMDKLEAMDSKLDSTRVLAKKAMIYSTGAITGFGILLAAILKFGVLK